MPRYDFRSPRLYVDVSLAAGAAVPLDRGQANYLGNVLRMGGGDPVLVFNGRDGEWCARLIKEKKSLSLQVEERTREQTQPPDLHYVFAPLKSARLDYMVQKAVELGVSQLRPVLTRHGQVERVNLDRMRANAIEAAEQCGILSIPEIVKPTGLTNFAAAWKADRVLIFCDEDADVKDPVKALEPLRGGVLTGPVPPTVLIGPEGGFAEAERAMLLKLPNVVRLPLGPRILRADTAAVAALTLVQAVLGDWR